MDFVKLGKYIIGVGLSVILIGVVYILLHNYTPDKPKHLKVEKPTHQKMDMRNISQSMKDAMNLGMENGKRIAENVSRDAQHRLDLLGLESKRKSGFKIVMAGVFVIVVGAGVVYSAASSATTSTLDDSRGDKGPEENMQADNKESPTVSASRVDDYSAYAPPPDWRPPK